MAKIKGVDRRFDLLSDVKTGKESWRFKVRILRLWSVPAFLNPKDTNSIEMVLVDEEGGKIHATVKKQLIYLFESKLCEGEMYQMSLFYVAPSTGSYRTTLHPHKLIFQMKTKVQKGGESAIPRYSLRPSRLDEVSSYDRDCDYLIDVIGVITGMSAEREYIRDTKITKMVVIELTDESGKCECAFFGSYVDELKRMMEDAADTLPVLVVQFAKVKIFRDKASIQNVINTTRILVNPDIPEVAAFKTRVDVHGMQAPSAVPLIGSRPKASLEDEFLKMYPKRSISQLADIVGEGNFVVGGTVQKLVDGQEWWYPACKCHKSVTPDSGSYYCNACARHVFHIVPRFKVKVEVGDGEADGTFLMFDNDISYIVEKSCATLVAAAKTENAGFYPPEFDYLIGKKILLVVDTNAVSTHVSDGSYRVKRACMDLQVIKKFDEVIIDCNSTPDASPDDSGDLSDDCEVVKDSQLSDSVDGVMVTPDKVRKDISKNISKSGASVSKVKRDLTKVFEGMDGAEGKGILKAVKIEK